ncbi:hypothetical protein BH10PAT3_BH10PAT3_6140 [soil metagenome]
MADIKRKMKNVNNKAHEMKGKVEGRMEQKKKDDEQRSANEE